MMSAGLCHHSVSNSIFYVRIKMAADLELGVLACRCRLKINTFEAQAGAKVGQSCRVHISYREITLKKVHV